ncbi:hypothetical protein K461DRAFT_295370 [Myriangium duriaei CBS 260.36]|uniref:Uncharacterized protein n=1 Tax=Myriangium duriaei CBS 260.36 TaxID=1168546 RepID=A0A9P4MEK8_9PEZI|nr:hypothetical protein K461DRAFT_295370 [Myriangium duriaei CBS 260.36]
MSGHHWLKAKGNEPAHAHDVNSQLPSTELDVFALLGAIAGVFWSIDGKPLSRWHFFLSLNAIISILTTGCAVTFMHSVSNLIGQLKWHHFRYGPQELADLETFDKASRGPSGSLEFLCAMKWSLATVGALITISRLAIGPLVQQIVKYPEESIYRPDETATISYAHDYNRHLSVPDLDDTDLDLNQAVQYDPKMVLAVLQGMYGVEVSTSYNCSGVCKWSDPFISFGFKSTCENVTLVTLMTENCSIHRYDQSCTMMTPRGIQLVTERVNATLQTTFLLNVDSSISRGEGRPRNRLPEIAAFAVYRATASATFDPLNINITECVLSVTAYEYSGSRANGSSFQIGETKEIGIPSDRWLENAAFPDGWWKAVATTFSSEGDDIPKFSISWADIIALQDFFLSDAFSGHWAKGSSTNVQSGTSPALMGDVDLWARFENMAASMTEYLRAGPNQKVITGQRAYNVTFVSIQWVWLAGPVAIELAAFLFAFLAIVRNRKSRKVPLWKSSALALLACQYEKDLGNRSGLLGSHLGDVKAIEKFAKEQKARLA